jgi:dolichol-phosphate mannosyltransferase
MTRLQERARADYAARMARELVFTATFNEVGNIEAWVTSVAQQVPGADMLVIDDNSPDGTAAVLHELQDAYPQLAVVVRGGKMGLNTAHLQAMSFALDRGYDTLVTMDADASHQPSQIAGVTSGLITADFCIGTRYRGGSHQSAPMRRVLSLGANRAAMALLPTGLSEYTTSFRAFNARTLETLVTSQFRASGYAFFIEQIEILHQAGYRLVERPIDFLDRAHGASKIPRSQILSSGRALASLSFRRRIARS